MKSNTIYFDTNGEGSFTSYKFYNLLLPKLYDYYHSKEFDGNPPLFSFEKPCYIDPITLPLIAGIGLFLKEFHNSEINLQLSNTPATIKLIRFLDKSDFFFLVGNNINPYFPIGNNIYLFNENAVGGYSGYFDKEQRKEHKIRGYSINDKEIQQIVKRSINDEDLRDNLIEYFKFLIPNQFGVLLEDKTITSEKFNDFVDILSELITNSLVHSESDCFALMHTNKYRTALSIVDIGIGFYSSFDKKESNGFYEKFQIVKSLRKDNKYKLSTKNENNLFSIFEALYYSLLRHRRGLFDLMINVTNLANGTFRIHNYSSQVIISSRFNNHLKKLRKLREQIFSLHKQYESKKIDDDEFNKLIMKYSIHAYSQILDFAKSVLNKFSENIRFSSIRVNEVELGGVHIEVEIPNEEVNYDKL